MFVIVLAAPFLASGLYLTHGAGSLVFEWVAMRDWQTAEAQLDSLQLDRSRVASIQSGSSPRYRVAVTYSYEAGGRGYRSDRVGLHRGSDGFGGWHERVYEALRAAHGGGERVACYYDPAAPERSVLRRDLRPGLLLYHGVLAVSLVGAGIGLTVAGARQHLAARKRHESARPDSRGEQA